MNKPKLRTNKAKPRAQLTLTIKTREETPRTRPNQVQRALSAREPKRSFYRPIKVLGKGAFGVVYSAKSSDGSIVAVKRVQLNPHYKNRELDTLKMLNHPNCIRLKDEFKSQGRKPNTTELSIVMDYLPMSLHHFTLNYRKMRQFPPIFYVKLFAYQIFTGLAYLHSIGITHRDMKPENVLVDPDTGELKICDFGSAKMLQPGEKSVAYIASRFYRAPELIYGCESYTTAVDIWAAGCVIAELLTSGNPLFAAAESENQILEIIAVLGLPTKKDLASFKHPPIKLRGVQKTNLQSVLPSRTPADIIDLLKSILIYNPQERPTAVQCMQHPCFQELFGPSVRMPNGKPIPPLEKPPIG